MKRWVFPTVAVSVALAFTACSDRGATAPEAPERQRSAVGEPVQGQWIVVFEGGVADAPGLARRLVSAHGGNLRFTYQHGLKGFSAELSDAAVQAIRSNPNVSYVEPNRYGGIVATTQQNATWGIDRVDQRDLPLSGTYTYDNDGASANVYVLDTGIRLSHEDFEGRAKYAPNGSNGDFVGDGHGSAEDCHGHGTHVASTAGGEVWGVAKGTALWAARVVDCRGSGTVDMPIAAIDWLNANGQKPAAVNMSLGYGDVQSLRDAVTESVNTYGFNYAVAAGNGHWLFGTPLDACNESPAGALAANTVGATDSNDDEAYFSNYGTCVDILAPGVSVTAADYSSTTGSATYSGTSMAAPHVAGAIALYLTANSSASPSQVSQALKDNASANKIALHSSSQSGGTPNLLLYTAFIGSGGGGGGGDENVAPTANFTYECTDLACSFTDTSTDSDGFIAGWSWAFGDDDTSTLQNPSHTYAADGTYTVTLTVTDDDGATGTSSQSVTVSASTGGGGFTLDATGYKVRGRWHADLTWSGASSTNVDVYRSGALVATTPNDGAYTDSTNIVGGGSLTYKVCEAGTNTCSNEVTVTF